MLHDLLKELYYSDGGGHALGTLQKHRLDTPLTDAVVAGLELAANAPGDRTKLTQLTARSVVALNSILSQISEPAEKHYLEIICRDVAGAVLRKIIKNTTDPAGRLTDLRRALEAACSIGGYNLGALLTILEFEQLEEEFAAIQIAKIPSKICYYDWYGKASDLDNLAVDLKQGGCIASKREFKLLFSKDHTTDLTVRFDAKQIDFVLTIIMELKKKRLLSPRGNKGQFNPLSLYGVDLEGNVLFKTPPRAMWYNIRRQDTKKAQKLIENAERLVSRFKRNVNDVLTLANVKQK